MDFDKIKISQLNENRQRLRAMDLTNASVTKVVREVERAFGVLPILGNSIVREFPAMRAREIDEKKEDISKIETFSYPPAMYADMGRANLIAQPVFYSAINAGTAMREINAVEGREYYVAVWEKEADVNMDIALYTLHLTSNEIHEVEFNHWNNSAIDGIINSTVVTPKARRSFLHALRLRSSIFKDDSYDISAKIAYDLLFDNSKRADAILYPSVKDTGKACMAIRPSFLDENFKLLRCYKFRYMRPPSTVQEVLARGVVEGRHINWYGLNEFRTDSIDRKYFYC